MEMQLPDGLATMGAGIITLATWTMCPDGETYLYLWCYEWRLATDAEMPAPNFRSSERWQAFGVGRTGHLEFVIPGCQVKAFVVSDEPPSRPTVYSSPAP
jgi:hypothetical protein